MAAPPWCSAKSTLAEQYKKLMLAPAGFARALYERGYKYTFFTGNCLSDNVATGYAKMLESLPDATKPKSIAYATLQNIAFTAATRGAQQDTKPLDMKMLLDLTYPPSINDATPMISDIKQASPDLVFQTGMSGDTVMFVRAAKEQGLSYKLLSIGYTAASLPNFLGIVGDAAEGAVYATGWEPEAKLGHNAEFVAAYEKEYGTIPTYNSANGYARWEILEQLVNETKSLDQTVLRDKLAGGTFETVNGTIKYSGKKCYSVPDSTLVVQFQHGKRVIVWPKEQATGSLIYPISH